MQHSNQNKERSNYYRGSSDAAAAAASAAGNTDKPLSPSQMLQISYKFVF